MMLIKQNSYLKKIKTALDACGQGRLLVHSDIMHAMKAVKLVANKNELLSRHIKALEYCAGSRPLLFPTFNYNFPKTQEYHLASTPSEVGHLSEYARTHWAQWRTEVPMYHFCGQGEELKLNHQDVINPFGEHSVFAELTQNDGVVLMYGASFSRSTIIHYIEQMFNKGQGPLYRFDKEFYGEIIQTEGSRRAITLVNHVRPLNKHLSYDWLGLEQDLLRDGLLIPIKEGASTACVYSARKIFDYILNKTESDPFYLLDQESRQWVAPMVEKLGRRLHLSDFES